MDMKKKCIGLVFTLIILNSTGFAYRDRGYQYLYPKPGSDHVYKGTPLIIRFDHIQPQHITNLSSFVNITDQTGRHRSGTCKIASDGKTVIFTPEEAFAERETVHVSLSPEVHGSAAETIAPISYEFTVRPIIEQEYAEPVRPTEPSSLRKNGTGSPGRKTQAMTMPNGVSVPSDFPHVSITVNDNPDDGYIFIDNRGGSWHSQPYNVIFDNTGSPVWYWRVPDERRDFKVQKNGWATMMIRWGYEEFGGSGAGYLAIDEHYNPVKTYYATNGYYTDEHELQVLENGGYLIIGRKDEWVDMSQIVSGGQTHVNVQSTCIQEYTASNELIFEWSAWENLDIRDVQLSDIYSSHIYFSHMNSIDVDTDGNLIISSRELSEVCKINRQSGDFIWRLGGAHSDFTFVNDPLNGFRNQHTARVLGNNVYSVFDNGNGHNPQVSRAAKYRLDTNQMTATLIWEFIDDPPTHSYNMGNAQQLPNGNMLINWARTNLPKVTEVRPDGTKAFEMNWVDDFECYRVHRCDWNGMSEVPRLEYELYSDHLILIFNKFGDPDVDHYNIYAGTSPNPTTLYATSDVSMKNITNLENGNYRFRVTAVSSGGQESGYSNEESIYISFAEPGENLVQNGDFAQGDQNWTWELQNTGQAQMAVENGEVHVAITNGGSNDYDVQLRQNGLPLVQGKTYIFEFDARASASRVIEAKVGQDQSPFINYSKSTYFNLRTASEHFTYEFEMEDNSDFNARIVFNMGNSTRDVYLDNISLRQKVDQCSFHDNNSTIPGLIECEEYDFGGEGIAFHDDGGKDGNGDFRPADNVDVQDAEDGNGSLNVGWTNDGEWLEYTVDVESGYYTIEYRTASDPGGALLRVLLDNIQLCEFSVDATGGWQNWVTLSESGIWIDGGTNSVLRLEIVQGDQNLNWIRFTKEASAVNDENLRPGTYALGPNFPNPFNPATKIDYQLPERNHILIQVHDIMGRHVRTLINRTQDAGQYDVTWDGAGQSGKILASGIYFITMKSGPFSAVRKVMLLR
ncbi:aryl-sulfate sulfotransferase [bacterium]|nr:aryl-sulfate sulfotransferase [bacterium]